MSIKALLITFSGSSLYINCLSSDCYSLLWRIFNEAYVPHGLKVVQAYAEHGLRGLMDLERRWRQHFLTTMQPRHLPPLWSVDHNHSKFLRKYGEDLPIKLNWLSDTAEQLQIRSGNNIFLFSGQSARWNFKSHCIILIARLLYSERMNALIYQPGPKCYQRVAAVKFPLWC